MANKSFLLDTNVALWILTGDNRLSEQEFRKTFFSAKSSTLLFHQVSTWEIQIKHSLGKLPLPEQPQNFLLEAVRESGFSYETISDRAIFFLGKLPPLHRDPFDRLLIAHAILGGYTIITSDRTLAEYPVPVELV